MRARFLPLAALLLSGCSEVGPLFSEPDVPTPQAFAEAAGPISVPESSEADLTRWWSIFHDPELDSLINRGLAQNLDLKTAASRVRESREQEIIADAARQPSVSAAADTAQLHSGRNFFSSLSSAFSTYFSG